MTEPAGVKTITGVSEMRRLSDKLRGEGSTISFVPTMGALHEGHLSLMREGRKRGDVLVASVFVNPAQFGPREDYDKYTRDPRGDLEKMDEAGVDIAFFPEAGDIYPDGFQTYVTVTELEKPLCGAFRPGHFRGVATVVLKLFNIVKPHVAVFGRKDYQQLQVIKKMVSDLGLDIEITGMPVYREVSGLAMSSRNSYLNGAEKEKAGSVYRALTEIKLSFDNGQRQTHVLTETGRRVLSDASVSEIDYLEIRDGETLGEVRSASPGDVAAVAVRIGGTRLIDNIEL